MELSEENLYFSIKSVTQILYRLYCRLAILESQEKDTSLEYEKTLKLIEFYTALEDQYYENVEKLLKKDEDIVERMYVNTLLSTESNFSPEKSLSDPSYMIFHDFKENDVVPMRMATKLYEISIQNSEEANQLGKRVYNEYESQRDTYFIDIIDSMIKDNTYKNFKKMLIKAKYKIAFINKKRKPEEPSDDMIISTAMAVANSKEIISYAQKMYRLNKSSIESPSNTRKILLSSAYIRANLLQMDELALEILNTLLTIGEDVGELKPGDGKTLFDSILKKEKEDKETFKEKGNTLKRKF